MEHSWFETPHEPYATFTVIEEADLQTYIGFYKLRERVRVKATSRKVGEHNDRS